MILQVQLPQRIVLSIGAVLASLICFLCIYSIWRWYSDWVITHQLVTSAPQSETDEIALMITAIPENHLFGKAFDQTHSVPVTDLELRITGIVKVEKENQEVASKVYISIQGQPSKIYQMGDSLLNGVKVYNITQDAVILENNGKLEKLPLPRERLQFKPPPSQEHF